MDLQEWCEYMRDVKALAHLTNADIAREADVSVKTIDRLMAINIEQDIMRSTARRIELAVVGAVSKHICELDLDDSASTEMISGLMAENESLRLRLDSIDEQHRADVRAIRDEYQEQLTFLKDELRAWRSLNQKQN